MAGRRSADRGRTDRGWVDLACVVAVSIMVFWLRLGADGLTDTEGHRALPAWAMLDGQGWLIPRLFGHEYLRKPPGVYWAMAGSSWLLGRTEFAVRAVSAAASVAMALTAFAVASRWFGRVAPRAGLAAGLAQALTPVFWQSGRAAEIEALHNALTQAATLSLLAALLAGPARRRARAVLAVGAGVALGLAILTKGPSGLVMVAAAGLGAAIARGSWRTLARPELWGALAVAASIAAPVSLAIAARASADAVVQSPGEFLWRAGRTFEVVTLPAAAIASALPASALLVVWWVGAARPRPPFDDATGRACSLGWTVVLGLLAYTVIGLDNPRYAQPALSLVAPLAGWALGSGWTLAGSGAVGSRLRRWAETVRRGPMPARAAVALAVASVAYVYVVEPARDERSGRAAGELVAEVVWMNADSRPVAEIWADHVISARPEVLSYAKAHAAAVGVNLVVRWIPGLADTPVRPPMPVAGGPPVFIALRRDPPSGESARFTDAYAEAEYLRHAGSGTARFRVHDFSVGVIDWSELVRVLASEPVPDRERD